MMHIILLRGLAREAAHWLEFPELLRKATENTCQLHLIDFPGCGKYCKQPALRSIAAMTDHARAEIASISAMTSGENVFIVGISMGGMVALDWAQRFSQEVCGLILINSSSGDQPVWWRLRPRAWLIMLLAFLLPRRQREALVLRTVSNDSARYPKRLQQWLAIQQQRPVTRRAIFTMLRAAAQFQPQPACAVNGLVLASSNDRMVSVRASESLAEYFNWPLKHHPHAGHDLPTDDGQWVVNEITQWIYANR